MGGESRKKGAIAAVIERIYVRYVMKTGAQAHEKRALVTTFTSVAHLPRQTYVNNKQNVRPGWLHGGTGAPTHIACLDPATIKMAKHGTQDPHPDSPRLLES